MVANKQRLLTPDRRRRSTFASLRSANSRPTSCAACNGGGVTELGSFDT